MTGRVCAVEGCGRAPRSKGKCHKHYEHERTYGRAERKTTGERFWEKVRRTETCWLWTAARNHRGYGKFCADGRYVYAHRFAYELLVGPIPAGLTLDHICRTPLCVNPGHLEPVTLRENRLRASASITHCPHGHAYTPENTAIGARGERRCRECNRARNRAYRSKENTK